MHLVVLVMGATVAVAGEPKVFQEKGGLLVIEVESSPSTAPWVSGTATAGYTGASYTAWEGPDVTKWPPAKEVFAHQFRFKITKPGRYIFAVRNWIKQEYASYFVQLDGAPTHDHYFSFKKQNVQKWSWTTWVDTGTEHKAAYFDLTAGEHTLGFKGRTGYQGILLDRFHLYMSHVPDPLSTSLPESPSR